MNRATKDLKKIQTSKIAVVMLYVISTINEIDLMKYKYLQSTQARINQSTVLTRRT